MIDLRSCKTASSKCIIHPKVCWRLKHVTEISTLWKFFHLCKDLIPCSFPHLHQAFQKSCTAATFAKPSMAGSTRCTSVVCKFPEDGATLKAHLRNDPRCCCPAKNEKKQWPWWHQQHVQKIMPSSYVFCRICFNYPMFDDHFELLYTQWFFLETCSVVDLFFQQQGMIVFFFPDAFVAKGRMKSIIAFPRRNASSQTQKTSQGG